MRLNTLTTSNACHYVCWSCKNARRASENVTGCLARRRVHITATPSSTQPATSTTFSDPAAAADARFEVLGSPSSILSASLSASQTLYTRKGTVVGFHGKPENAVSTLSLLEPFRRAILGIPFTYQSISSTTPYTALIAPKSPITSLVVLHLDGRLDWMVTQRNALLAWTGHTLTLKPTWNTKMGLAHWGNTTLTGRGLVALSGHGLAHQISVKAGEEYVVHPANVIAYSVMQHAPQPYRFKSNSLRLQIPNPLTWLPDTRFWRTMRKAALWRLVRDALFRVRTWTRRTIWGDRLFLHFRGPVTLLVQSRGSRIKDVLTSHEVNEIADSPAGSVPAALHVKAATEPMEISTPSSNASPTTMSYATVNDGTVKFDDSAKTDAKRP